MCGRGGVIPLFFKLRNYAASVGSHVVIYKERLVVLCRRENGLPCTGQKGVPKENFIAKNNKYIITDFI
jgi:hypothetical protein